MIGVICVDCRAPNPTGNLKRCPRCKSEGGWTLASPPRQLELFPKPQERQP